MSVEPHEQCQALVVDPEFGVHMPPRRCSRAVKHWTHGFDVPDHDQPQRLNLCTQHFEMIERRRRLGSADEALAYWHSQS